MTVAQFMEAVRFRVAESGSVVTFGPANCSCGDTIGSGGGDPTVVSVWLDVLYKKHREHKLQVVN